MAPTKMHIVHCLSIMKTLIETILTAQLFSNLHPTKTVLVSNACLFVTVLQQSGSDIVALFLDSTEHISKQNTKAFCLVPPVSTRMVPYFHWPPLLLMPRMTKIGYGSSNCSVTSLSNTLPHCLHLKQWHLSL